jgi:hypothetical protein
VEPLGLGSSPARHRFPRGFSSFSLKPQARMFHNGQGVVPVILGDLIISSTPSIACVSLVRMKTERKYPEPTVFVFYIMIPFLNIKNCQFQLVSQLFSTIFLYSLIAKM